MFKNVCVCLSLHGYRWMSETLASRPCSPPTSSTWTPPAPATGRPRPLRASWARSRGDGSRRSLSRLRGRSHTLSLPPLPPPRLHRKGRDRSGIRWTPVCRCLSSPSRTRRSSSRLGRNSRSSRRSQDLHRTQCFFFFFFPLLSLRTQVIRL